MEELSFMRSSQTLKQLCQLRGKSIIDLIARSPERVTPCFGQSVNLQSGIVGRHALEGNVRVPACACEAAAVFAEAVAAFEAFGAYDLDLVTELAVFFCQGVDVEAG